MCVVRKQVLDADHVVHWPKARLGNVIACMERNLFHTPQSVVKNTFHVV